MKPHVRSQCWQAAGPAARHAQNLAHDLILGLIVVVALAIGSAPARAASDGLSVANAWMRMIMPSRPAAGYFTLSNKTDKAQVLLSASSPACGMLMLHQSLNKNGEEHMVMHKSIAVPAHGTLTFAPGGYHLMCMSPTKDVVKGQSVPVTLHFANKAGLTANFMVRGATGK